METVKFLLILYGGEKRTYPEIVRSDLAFFCFGKPRGSNIGRKDVRSYCSGIMSRTTQCYSGAVALTPNVSRRYTQPRHEWIVRYTDDIVLLYLAVAFDTGCARSRTVLSKFHGQVQGCSQISYEAGWDTDRGPLRAIFGEVHLTKGQ